MNLNELQLKVFNFIRDTKKEYEDANEDSKVSSIWISIDRDYVKDDVTTTINDIHIEVTPSKRY